ncbi:MAG: DUF1439 domain-containing protein [Zoogloeaceae bacterium]|jgi:hypothetical protein|nr:DUF1439 domain-containing protein [Zoogloeaceae bacterium]
MKADCLVRMSRLINRMETTVIKVKKRLLIVIPLFALLVATLSACLSLSENGYVLRIQQDQIQAKINEKFPVTKPLLIFSITFENPRVTLKEGSDRIYMTLDVIANIPRLHQQNASIGVSSSIRYDTGQGAFYLVSPVIEQINAGGIPEKYIDDVGFALSILLDEYYATHPIYVLDTSKFKQSVAKMTLKSISVEDTELVIRFGP